MGNGTKLTRGHINNTPLVKPEPQSQPSQLDEIARRHVRVPRLPRVKHTHYFKDVARLTEVDVYRVLTLFDVGDPAIGHAIKKLLVAGGRGAQKTIDQDVQEAIDTLERWKEMRAEDGANAAYSG